MKAVVTGCMKNTKRLIAGMETSGIPRAATPDVNVATFTCDKARCPGPGKSRGPAGSTCGSSACRMYTGTGSRHS